MRKILICVAMIACASSAYAEEKIHDQIARATESASPECREFFFNNKMATGADDWMRNEIDSHDFAVTEAKNAAREATQAKTRRERRERGMEVAEDYARAARAAGAMRTVRARACPDEVAAAVYAIVDAAERARKNDVKRANARYGSKVAVWVYR